MNLYTTNNWRDKYKAEYAIANRILFDELELDGVLAWSTHDYIAFTFKNRDISLVFYPHKTSAFNYHIRVRNNGSKDIEKANTVMSMLDEGAGYNCTFSRKHQRN